MTRWLRSVIPLVLLFCCASAHADEASKRVKIRKLFQVTRQAETLQQQMAVTRAEVERLLPTLFPTTKLNQLHRAEYDQLLKDVMRIMQESSDWKIISVKYEDAYDATYSEATIDGLLAFYRTDVGQDVVAKRVPLAFNLASVKRAVLESAQPRIVAVSQKYVDHLRSDGARPSSRAK